MSGLKENLNAGENSHSDSSLRHRAARDQGAESSLKLSDLARPASPVRNVDGLSLSPLQIQSLSESRHCYDAWIAGLVTTLSARGQELVRTRFFELLKDVPNSTAKYSRVLSHVDVTRWDHCIHAAHSVRVLGEHGGLGLTPYETNVLELVMLLHDPHRKGSHALDRVFASMPGAPKNFKDWWAKDDYHEYHGAKSVATEPELRKALGKYQADVLAILAYDDKRSVAEQHADYGVLYPRLKPQRIEALYHLKDELDRCSYLKLDYLRSGFSNPLVLKVISDVSRHELTLSAHGSGMQINIARSSAGRPYDDVAKWRRVYRADLATLPIGCLAEKAIFHDGVWDKARETFSAKDLESPKLYEFVRDAALKGEYHKIYSEDALSLLQAAESGVGLTVEDVYAPLVTMTLADVSDVAGRGAIDHCVPPGLAQSICGVPRKDMTRFEAGIREALRAAGLDKNIHVLMSNDFRKTLRYAVSHDGAEPVEEVVYTDCQPSMIKVIVAARAIDTDGATLDLSEAKRVVHDFLKRSKYLNSDEVLATLNPHVFRELTDASVFKPEMRLKMGSVEFAWIERGGCGLM